VIYKDTDKTDGVVDSEVLTLKLIQLKLVIFIQLVVTLFSLLGLCSLLFVVDHAKKCFQDLLSQHSFFCQINFIIIYLVEITYYFEFLMIKLISFIVLTHFFQFNQLKILKQPRLVTFF